MGTVSNSIPRVSIGLPVYNAACLLPVALNSLQSQTYSDFELIISDNASTDDTETLCREYAKQDPRIRYVRQQINRGSTWNFNEVFRLARGEYFKWAAYDDICHPTYVERCVDVLEQNPEVLWCHSRSQHIDAEGKLLLGHDTAEISYVELPRRSQQGASNATPTRADRRPSARFRAVLLGRDGCLDSYGLIRSAVLRKTALFLPYFGSEKVLMAELGLWGRYQEIPETLFWARVHAKAAGSQRTSRLQRAFINPLAGKSWSFARWYLLRGYVAAVRRAPISAGEKARCYEAICRYVLQFHKWKAVLVKAFTGRGLASDYPSASIASRSRPVIESSRGV